jgi:hypothetical protein
MQRRRILLGLWMALSLAPLAHATGVERINLRVEGMT